MRTFSSLYLKKVLTSTVTWEFMSRERERERERKVSVVIDFVHIINQSTVICSRALLLARFPSKSAKLEYCIKHVR